MESSPNFDMGEIVSANISNECPTGRFREKSEILRLTSSHLRKKSRIIKPRAEAGAATQHLLKKHLSFRWFPGAPEGSFFNEKEFHHLHMGENTRSWSVITRNIGQLKHGPKFWSPTQCCKRVEPILHGIIPLINLNPLKEWFPDSPLVAPANLPAI